ncbi:ABC transporter permease subunit [Candidatus Peregrinibacteria bacterium]|nr:MAG: ABC transporter permease subunit [Candidatus Peregrinibacteria bacterium]
MRTLLALTKNTFRETIRDRILLVIAFFGVILIFASQLLSTISVRQDEKMIVDLGLGMIDVFGMIITIFVGTQLIFREIDKKTIFIILSKPVPRWTFLLSKFFGLGAILFLVTVIMLVVFIGVIAFSTDLIIANNHFIQLDFVGQLVLISSFSLLSFLLLLGVVIFFSSFMSPILAAFSSLTIFVIGHITDDIRMFAKFSPYEDISRGYQIFSDVVYYGFPNFSILNLKNFILNDIFPTSGELFAAATGAVLWITLFVTVGTLLFSRREF